MSVSVWESMALAKKKEVNDLINSINKKAEMRCELLKQQIAVEREVQNQLIQNEITSEEYQEKIKEIKNEYERKKEEMDIA